MGPSFKIEATLHSPFSWNICRHYILFISHKTKTTSHWKCTLIFFVVSLKRFHFIVFIQRANAGAVYCCDNFVFGGWCSYFSTFSLFPSLIRIFFFSLSCFGLYFIPILLCCLSTLLRLYYSHYIRLPFKITQPLALDFRLWFSLVRFCLSYFPFSIGIVDVRLFIVFLRWLYLCDGFSITLLFICVRHTKWEIYCNIREWLCWLFGCVTISK